jgi:alpha/beta superfamily hydrolase
MEVPSILQGESLTRLLQGAAVGAVVTMVVGFSWGGWSLGSTADKMAKDRSDLAVVAALAPVCADKFRALPDAEAKTVALSKVDSWKRGEEFPKELVTLPGETYRNSALVTACYALLAPKSAALQ